jgi:hypothetical protein
MELTTQIRSMLSYGDMFTCELPGGGGVMVLAFESPIGQMKV